MIDPRTHELFFRQVLPGIEENVRNHDQLEPCMIVKFLDGRDVVCSMSKLFQDGQKDAIMPVIGIVFQNKAVELIALISECWIAQMKPGEFDEYRKQPGCLEDYAGSVDGVLVSIYGRDGRDSIFSLKIKPDRSGVEQHMNNLAPSGGRFVRHNPENN